MVVAANVSTATCVVVAIVTAATGAVCSHVHGAGASSHDSACTMPSAHSQTVEMVDLVEMGKTDCFKETRLAPHVPSSS